MNQKQWLKTHAGSLEGKTVALTGATGDLGREICRAVLCLGGSLILLCRSAEKSRQLKTALLAEYPGREIREFPLDLADLGSVDRACAALEQWEPDILVHNAGVYAVPRYTCPTGLDNIFQINFLSPYYMTRQLLPMLSRRGGKVLAMGSIAHNYAPTDPRDPDFSTRKKCSLAYGNAKRYLMYSLEALRPDWPRVDFGIAHPGITLTNMSAHHPPLVFALIKGPMKLIFPGREKAVRGLILAMTGPVPPLHWIGPRYFHIWGNPGIRPLNTCPEAERRAIADQSEHLYRCCLEHLEHY